MIISFLFFRSREIPYEGGAGGQYICLPAFRKGTVIMFQIEMTTYIITK